MNISPVTVALMAATIVAASRMDVTNTRKELIPTVPAQPVVEDIINLRPRRFGAVHNEALIQRRDPQQASIPDNLPEITVTVTTCSNAPVVTVTVTTCKARGSETAPAQQTGYDQSSVPAQANEATMMKVALMAAVAPLVVALL